MSQCGSLNFNPANPQIPLEFVTDSGAAIALANQIEILGGLGATTEGSGNTITINAEASGFDWELVLGVSQTLAEGHGYVAGSESQVQFSLPVSANFGDTYIVSGFGSGGWKINLNSGQNIRVGTQNTSAGASGSVASGNAADSVQIICISANLIFKALFWQGNLVVS